MKWYTDSTARATHLRLQQELSLFIANCFPNYELTHTGFNQDFNSGEVVVKLHLNPKGKVKCSAYEPPLLGEQ